MLAIAILVANGVLLFVILRFLLWLAFPGKRDEEAAVAAARPAVGAAAAANGGKATTAAAAAVVAHPPEPLTPAPTPGMPMLAATSVGRSRAYPHRLLIGLPVILALFAGGVWLGSVVGGSGAAAAATHTIHVTGTVVTVNSRTVVRVPATNVKVKGSIVSVPETTVRLPRQVVTRETTRTVTTTKKLPGKTVTTGTTVVIPTTITGPTTTATVTVTTTDTATSGTSTTSTSATT
ncbi:MAG TPA: hypothetical protein VJN72_04410 [Gaiellales bacterium]|nr:hypothetical protein [Gaiellales bacterium]